MTLIMMFIVSKISNFGLKKIIFFILLLQICK